MKKTVCRKCGGAAKPLYIRIKIDGEEKKGLQYVRCGEWCLDSACETIMTDNGSYTKLQPTPEEEARRAELRAQERREDLKRAMREMIREDPEFFKYLIADCKK